MRSDGPDEQNRAFNEMPLMTATSKRILLAVALSVLFVLPAFRASAGQYTNTKLPMWQVGSLNKTLSNACQRREFNQVKQLRLTIGYNGEKGQGITGVARMGWNLYDPLRVAEPGFTYHFFHDGHSDCRVYIAGSRLSR